MVTPKHYLIKLKEGQITNEMLGDVIFSLNKRAKNMRDKERDYRTYHSKYNYVEKYRDKKEEYYDKKDKCLKLIKPTCIHRVECLHHKKIWFDGWYEWEECVKIEYFLLYRIGNHSFHHPISEDKLSEYSELAVIDIDDLITIGTHTDNLLSVQFCDKVIKGIEDKTLELVA